MNSTQPILVLTGASRGIGHATVKRFSEEGWRVITCSRHAFPDNCPWPAGEEDHLQIDLADRSSIENGISELLDCLGGKPLNALVNNAGISPKREDDVRMDSINTEMDVWDHFFRLILCADHACARLSDALAKDRDRLSTSPRLPGQGCMNLPVRLTEPQRLHWQG